jgi:catechol 2,3-dioxygenase-like lactoylglutathione lyase family enzyme
MAEMGITEGFGGGLPGASPKNSEIGGNPEFLCADPDGNGVQFQDENSCGGAGYLGNLCDFSTTAIRIPGDPPPVEVATLHHMKFVVSNLQRSLAWYQKLTDMKVVTYQEVGPRTEGYQGGPVAILQVGTGPQYFALTEGKNGDPGSHERPHFGFGIKGFDANQIMKRLAEHGVAARVRIREGVTPEIQLTDPEGKVEIQLNDVNNRGGGGVLGDVIDPRVRPFPSS